MPLPPDLGGCTYCGDTPTHAYVGRYALSNIYLCDPDNERFQKAVAGANFSEVEFSDDIREVTGALGGTAG